MEASIYVSDEFISEYDSKSPVIFTTVVAALFALMLCVFLLYDASVDSRKTKFVKAANQSNKILQQLFPSNIHDRLLADKSIESQFVKNSKNEGSNHFAVPFPKSSDHLYSTMDHSNMYLTPPIADLFLNTTVFYGDIVGKFHCTSKSCRIQYLFSPQFVTGFTSWSSLREPFQVFVLLETLFREFDKVANKRKIYKVETVGDCYVAVCGLPNPRKDHAGKISTVSFVSNFFPIFFSLYVVEMSRFAMECMGRTKEVTAQLATTLGPGTEGTFFNSNPILMINHDSLIFIFLNSKIWPCVWVFTAVQS